MKPIARSRDGSRLVFDRGDGYGQILDAHGVLYPPTLLAAIGKFGGWFDLDDFDPPVDPAAALRRLAKARPFDTRGVTLAGPVFGPQDVEKRARAADADDDGDLVEYSESGP